MKEISRYLVIGCGGVGGSVARELAHFLSIEEPGATLFLVDGDVFEERNRGRQVFRRGGPKPIVLGEELAGLYAGRVNLVLVPEYATAQRARRLVLERSVVFLAPDNHATRLLFDRRCGRLDDVVLISGGNDGVEEGSTGTYGNVQIYVRVGGRDRTNPLRRFHPEIERPRDRLPTELGCQAQLASAPQLRFTNLTVAAAMLNAFQAWRRDQLAYEELYFDTLTGRAIPVHREVAEPERDYSSASSSSSPSPSSSPDAGDSPPPKR